MTKALPMLVPVVPIDHVFHLGTMNVADRGRNHAVGSSYEGECLSVSLCPNAWEAIARLGGNGCHRLERPGSTFVDVLTCIRDRDVWAAIHGWALEEELVRTESRFRVWTHDDERGAWSYILTDTRESAVGELSEHVDVDEDAEDFADLPAPEGHEAIERIDALVGSARLRDLTAMDVSDDARDACVVAWTILVAAKGDADVQGVWWNEDLDPQNLSAPRGGILASHVAGWRSSVVDLDEVDDGAEVSRMSISVVRDVEIDGGKPTLG